MANKNILVSSNAKYEPISASVGDVAGVLSSSLPVTANTSSFVAQSGLMQIYSGKLMPVGNTSTVNVPSDGIYSGSVLTYNNSEGFAPSRASVASFNGDISGDTISGVKVRSVSNVTGGVLQSLYGGIGTSSFSANSLITTNGSGLIPTETNKIVVASSNAYINGDTQLLNFSSINDTLVYLYTGSVGADVIFNWVRPTGCRFVRVICQGGGGGGSSGGRSDGLQYSPGGSGGGNSEATFAVNSLPSNLQITVGRGGTGGVGVVLGSPTAGQSGGVSRFGNYLFANGGSSTAAASTSAPGGAGYSISGGGGGFGQYGNGVSITTRIGAPGGGAGAGNATGQESGRGGAPFNGAQNPGVVYLNAGNHAVQYDFMYFKKYYLNSSSVLASISFPKLSCTGGSGAGGGAWAANAIAPNGGNGAFGSGGGGGGHRVTSFSNTKNGNGGNGGAGYVLIICY